MVCACVCTVLVCVASVFNFEHNWMLCACLVLFKACSLMVLI